MRERIEELHNRAVTDFVLSQDSHAIRHALNTLFNEALELAAMECEKMRHPDDFTPESGQWFLACEDCAAAIRKLKVG